MTLLKRENIVAGLFFIVLAAGAGWISLDFETGTAARMGSGYFPLMLSILLFLLGTIILVVSGPTSDLLAVRMVELRALAAIVAAVVLFAVLLRPLGMLVTIFATAVLSSLGSTEFRPMRSAIIACGLSLFCYAVFSLLLDLRMPILPAFMGSL